MVKSTKTKKGGVDENDAALVLTIGHSTRTIEEFIEVLNAHGVTFVADIRTVPRSRRNPQFNLDELPASLEAVGIKHAHIAGLGGLRKTSAGSVNTGWRNLSFRGYADYMQTPEFEESLEELIKLSRDERVAIMCAEAVPWRCHRSLVGDALAVRGIEVEDIMSSTKRTPHKMTSFSKVDGLKITYPPIEE